MNISGWLLSKCDETTDGHRPIVASMSIADWHAPIQPLTPNGWSLVWITCDPAHYAFIKQDEDCIWLGNEWSRVHPQLLETFAEMLDPNETYQNLGQVIEKLAESEPRFLL